MQIQLPYYTESSTGEVFEFFAIARHSETLEELYLFKTSKGLIQSSPDPFIFERNSDASQEKKSQEDLQTIFNQHYSNDLPDVIENVEIGATYKHYKGGLYKVISVGKDIFKSKPLVYYTDANNNCWARPLSMWNESVDGVPRFAKASTELSK